MPSETQSTRRHLLGAIAGTAVAVPAAVVSAHIHSGSHARLISILEEYRTTLAFYCDVNNRSDELAFASRRMHPPASLMDMRCEGLPCPRSATERVSNVCAPAYEGLLSMADRMREIRRFGRWEAECDRIDVANGVPEAEDATDAAQAGSRRVG
jgi:hypothetical protein